MNRNLGVYLVLVVFTIFAETHQSAFPVGKQYSYDFSNDVFIKDFKNGRPIAYRTTGVFKVANILDANDTKLLKFTFESPQLNVRPHGSDSQTEFQYHKSPLENYQNTDFYGIWKQGNITDIYVDATETVALVNVKKSLASLFQYQTRDGDHNEIRTSGVCKVTYRETSPTGVQRIKQSCELAEQKKHFVRPEKALQINAKSYRSTDYEFSANGTVKKVDSRDFFRIALEANRNVGGSVDSIVLLVGDAKPVEIDAVDDKSPKEFLAKLTGYKGLKIEGTRQITEKIHNDINIRKAAKDYKKALSTNNVGTKQSAKAFLNMLSIARHADKEDVVQILETAKLADIKPQLLDILGTAQTDNTHAAVVEVIDFADDSQTDYVERYLQALAIGTRPNAKIIVDLLKIVRTGKLDKKVVTSIVHTLGSMGQRYAHSVGQNYSSAVVQKVLNYLNSSILSCNNQPPCYVKYINGLSNLRSTETIESLFGYLKHTERTVALAAMKALRRFAPSVWDSKYIQRFENIFFQIEHRSDSSVRTLALDIILESKLTDAKLNKLLGHLKATDRSFEVKKYLFEKLMMLSEQSADLNERIQSIIRSNRTLNNYDILNQKGLTNALSRKYSIQSPYNITLTSIQEIFKGILKSGVVDLSIDTDDDRYSFFTLGLYAGGLTSFVASYGSASNGHESDEIDEDTANAGMEITVQGAYLRPLEFFRGQAEVMGHIWSGTASEPTPAYVANSLLHDHHESFQLQNGATVSVDVESALSLDLNGAVQLSLWNRNAQIQVDNNAGLFLRGKILVNAGFASMDLNFNVEKEPKLNLNVDIDFSSENILCMQLSQPNDIFTYEIQKNQIIPEIGHHVKTSRKIKYNTLGSMLFLNRENNVMCNKIFPNDSM